MLCQLGVLLPAHFYSIDAEMHCHFHLSIHYGEFDLINVNFKFLPTTMIFAWVWLSRMVESMLANTSDSDNGR